MEQFRGWWLFYCGRMKSRELTAKQLSAVPCPTCGVAAGNSCVLHSGAPRSAPHVDRKFCAMDAIERARIRADGDFDNSACRPSNRPLQPRLTHG
jgi:hypothetical protein